MAKATVTVIRPFSIGSKLHDVGATVEMEEDQAKAMIACKKAIAGKKAAALKNAEDDKPKEGDKDHAK